MIENAAGSRCMRKTFNTRLNLSSEGHIRRLSGPKRFPDGLGRKLDGKLPRHDGASEHTGQPQQNQPIAVKKVIDGSIKLHFVGAALKSLDDFVRRLGKPKLQTVGNESPLLD